MICIAAALGLGATVLDRRLRAAGWPEHRRLPAVVAGVVLPMLVAYALLPPAPRDAGVALPGRLPGGEPDALGDADPRFGVAGGGGAAQAVAGSAACARNAHHDLLTCRRPCGARRDATRRGGGAGPVPACPPGPGDLLAADLIADPERLAAEIAATARGRVSADRQVLASL